MNLHFPLVCLCLCNVTILPGLSGTFWSICSPPDWGKEKETFDFGRITPLFYLGWWWRWSWWCKLQVYSIIKSHLYILQSEHPCKLSQHPSPEPHFVPPGGLIQAKLNPSSLSLSPCYVSTSFSCSTPLLYPPGRVDLLQLTTALSLWLATAHLDRWQAEVGEAGLTPRKPRSSGLSLTGDLG